MVATTSQRMMVNPTSRSMVNLPTDPTRAARRTPERCGKSPGSANTEVRTVPKRTPYRGERKLPCGSEAATSRGRASARARWPAGPPGAWTSATARRGEAVCQKAGEDVIGLQAPLALALVLAEPAPWPGAHLSSAVSQPSVCGNVEAQHSVCTRCSPTNGLVSGFEMRRSQAGQIGFSCASSLLVNARLQIRKVFQSEHLARSKARVHCAGTRGATERSRDDRGYQS